jgi:hypothetical protein
MCCMSGVSATPTTSKPSETESNQTLNPTNQDLIRIMHLGAVSVRLCPRAALTAKTPCGRYVRVWSIATAAPATAAADAAAGAVTNTGSIITGSTAFNSSTVSGGFITGSTATGLANATLSGDSLANFQGPSGFGLSGRAGSGGLNSSSGGGLSGTGFGLTGPSAGRRKKSRRRAGGGGGARRESTVTGGSLFTRHDGTIMSGATVMRNASMLGMTAQGLFGGGLTSTMDGRFLEGPGDGPSAAAAGALGADGRLLEPGVNPLAALTLDRMVSGMVTTYDDVGVGMGDVGVTHYVYVDENCPNVAEVRCV